MRKNIKIPRIIKISGFENFKASVIFNNGEARIIDFEKHFDELGILKNQPSEVLMNPENLKKASLENNTLSWNNVEQFITLKNGQKQKVPFEIGADVLYRFSEPGEAEKSLGIGKMIRENRLKRGLTQRALAVMSGTTPNYISRLENERSDIELDTLRKIVETGLGKHLEIKIR